MSYADPSKIRKHRVTIYLNDTEQALAEAVKNFGGGELAPLLRELMLDGMRRVLHGEHGALGSNGTEGVLKSSFNS
jgi:hypothetical protein